MERMTAEEERILKVYLTKTKAIQNESAFENWYSGRFDGDDGNAAFQHHLDIAHAWVAGYWMGWDAHRETVNKALLILTYLVLVGFHDLSDLHSKPAKRRAIPPAAQPVPCPW